MNRLIRALIAAWGAKKVGGGCLTTIIVFFVIYYALGTCNQHPVQRNSQLSIPLSKTAVICLLNEGRSKTDNTLIFSLNDSKSSMSTTSIVEKQFQSGKLKG